MIMREVLNLAEKKVGSAQQRSSRELSALLGEIDCLESRDGLRKRKSSSSSRSRKSSRTSETASKRSRREDRSWSPMVDHGPGRSRKLRKRSKNRGSNSTLSRHKKSKHKHRRHDREREQVDEKVPVSPRVNPIFLWIKQDNTKIVEVLCEDYDKRNRIRLTKTPNGWRAIPRTERLVSAISQSSLTVKPFVSKDTELVNTKPLDNSDSTGPESFETKDVSHGASNDVTHSNDESCVLDDQTDERTVASCDNSVIDVDQPEEYDSETHEKSSEDESDAAEWEDEHENQSDQASNDDPVEVRSPGGLVCDNVVESDCRLRDECEVNDPHLVVKPVNSEPVESTSGASNIETVDSIALQVRSTPEIDNDKPISETDNNRSILEIDNDRSIHEIDNDVSTLEIDNDRSIHEIDNDRSTLEKDNDRSIPEIDNDTKDLENDAEEEESSHENMEGDVDKSLASETGSKTVDLSCHQSESDVCPAEITSSEEVPQEKLEERFKTVLMEENNNSDFLEIDVGTDLEKDRYSDSFINGICKVGSVKSENPCENSDDSNSVQLIPDLDSVYLSQLSVKVEKEDNVDICNNFIFPNQDKTEIEAESPDVKEPESGKLESSSKLTNENACIKLKTLTECDVSLAVNEPLNPCKESVNSVSSDVKIDVPFDCKLTTKVDENQQNSVETEKKSAYNNVDEIKISDFKKTEECDMNSTKLTLNLSKRAFEDDPLDGLLDLSDSDLDLPLHQKLKLPEGTTISHIPGKSKMQSSNNPSLTPRPAHSNSQPNFLETLLSYPKSCHQNSSISITKTNDEPLDLGKSSKVSSAASPPVTCSAEVKKPSHDVKHTIKEKHHTKPNDITLKSLLNQSKCQPSEKKLKKCDLKDEELPNMDTATRSKLLELLTSKQSFLDSNPLVQLKDIMSNPDLIVPDPLLVPRARLPALIANPAREIPQLLARKSEHVSYPKPIPDPDTLVVSLAHLQSLLQKSGNETENWLKYQQHAQFLQSQLKNDQFAASMDPASAAALNQMFWLPYLNQLEASAAKYGGNNNQELLNMLSMITPTPHNFYQMNPFMVTPPSTPPMSNADFQQQMEFQKSLSMWHDAILKSSSNQFIHDQIKSAHDFHNNNISSKPAVSPMESNMNAMAAQYYRGLFEPTQTLSMTSARTNPISPNYQKNKPRSQSTDQPPNINPYLSQPALSQSSRKSSHSYYRPPSTLNQAPCRSSTNRSPHHNSVHKTEATKYTSKNLSVGPEWHRQSHNRMEEAQSPLYSGKSPKSKRPEPDSLDMKHSLSNFKAEMRRVLNPTSVPANFKSSGVKQSTTLLPHLNIEIPCAEKLPQTTAFMSPPLTREAPVDLSEIKKLPTVPKLKVKQHLVDPNAKPKLLKIEDHPEVVGSTTILEEDPHLQLWHPFFGSQENYRSPWQWTTPVTVSSE